MLNAECWIHTIIPSVKSWDLELEIPFTIERIGMALALARGPGSKYTVRYILNDSKSNCFTYPYNMFYGNRANCVESRKQIMSKAEEWGHIIFYSWKDLKYLQYNIPTYNIKYLRYFHTPIYTKSTCLKAHRMQPCP